MDFRMVKLFFLFVGILTFIVGSAYLGYQLYKPPEDGAPILIAAEPDTVASADEPVHLYRSGTAAEEEDVDYADQAVPEQQRITRDTRIMYEYLTADNNVEDLKEVTMPYYFLGMSEDELQDALIEGWRVKEFDEELVVLSRAAWESAQDSYTLGIHNGYIAVYYNEHAGTGGIKETINKPVSALSIDEQNRLMDGIPITGEEQLAKVLEAYGS